MIEALAKAAAEVGSKAKEVASSGFDPDKKVAKASETKENAEAKPKQSENYDPDKKVEKNEDVRSGDVPENDNETDSQNTENTDMRNCPIEGNGGHWTGERGNSTWIPDDNYVPEKANPEGLTWKLIKEKYGIEGIPFKNGEPDFSEISKGKVEIEGYSDSRPKNFAKADVELAKQRGCSPAEVREWREKNGYTWHESKDCKTMSKVPNDVHLNVPHRGGISTIKQGA